MEFKINDIVTYKGEKEQFVIIDIDWDIYKKPLIKIIPYVNHDLVVESFVYRSEIELSKRYDRIRKLKKLMNASK